MSFLVGSNSLDFGVPRYGSWSVPNVVAPSLTKTGRLRVAWTYTKVNVGRRTKETPLPRHLWYFGGPTKREGEGSLVVEAPPPVVTVAVGTPAPGREEDVTGVPSVRRPSEETVDRRTPVRLGGVVIVHRSGPTVARRSEQDDPRVVETLAGLPRPRRVE